MQNKIKDLFYDQFFSNTALDFIESSKCTNYNMREFGMYARSVMQDPFYMKQIISSTTELGCTEKVKLINKIPEKIKALRQIQLKRKSTRKYTKFLNFEELSALLLNSYFIIEKSNNNVNRRSIASGGGLYPIDLYYINLKIKGLEKGVYFYNLFEENLEIIKTEKSNNNFNSDFNTAFYVEHMQMDWDFETISGVIVFAGILNRVSCKYQDRGLRFALMDVGSILQNIHLAAGALDIDCCAIGGYLDDELNNFIGLAYPNECVLLTMYIAKN